MTRSWQPYPWRHPCHQRHSRHRQQGWQLLGKVQLQCPECCQPGTANTSVPQSAPQHTRQCPKAHILRPNTPVCTATSMSAPQHHQYPCLHHQHPCLHCNIHVCNLVSMSVPQHPQHPCLRLNTHVRTSTPKSAPQHPCLHSNTPFCSGGHCPPSVWSPRTRGRARVLPVTHGPTARPRRHGKPHRPPRDTHPYTHP